MIQMKRLLGAHQSVAGGLFMAFERIQTVGGTALQIFTRNQRQWAADLVSPDEARAFREAWEKWGNYPVASHASYLLNPASPDEVLRKRTAVALAGELDRCRSLAIPWVVLHPGSRTSSELEEAISRAAAVLDEALGLSGADDGPMILLENTAGQGSGLGSRFEELNAVMALSRHPERLGLCLDTCHAFAAGYDIRTREGLDALLSELDPARLKMVHVNDSKGGLGSKLDRHEHIGKGTIGLEGFRTILNHPVLEGLPMVLETPKEKDLAQDIVNLKVLRKLVKRAPDHRESRPSKAG